MLVHQCDSCNKLASTPTRGESLPNGWGRITLQLPYDFGSGSSGSTTLRYDMCNECASKPITFGNMAMNNG